MRKFNIILAVCKTDDKKTFGSVNYGIGKDSSLPWNDREELKLFKETTINTPETKRTLIMGRYTVESLPKLKDRKIICVSSFGPDVRTDKNDVTVVTTFEDAINICTDNEEIYVAGGGMLYQEAFKHVNLINELHLSIMDKEYECDTFVELDLSQWAVKYEKRYTNFIKKICVYRPEENQYLTLLHKISNLPPRKSRNALNNSCFFNTMSFDLRNGFPLITTKKVFFRGIVEELLFFLRGDTDTNILEEKGINIWKKNTEREFLDKIGKRERKNGMMGPMYGYQFRYFGQEYDEDTGKPKNDVPKGYDQLLYVIKTIMKDPMSRRIIMTSYNPQQAEEGVLFPCHSLPIQFYVSIEEDKKYLDMSCNNRSQDMFLGVPFNIASSALLLCIVAKVCGLEPRNLHMVLGDTHIYVDHLEACKLQLTRQPYTFPTVTVNTHKVDDAETAIKNIESLTFDDFILSKYNSHDGIKVEMIA